ncbi:MAG: AAA family ATPase [Actinomycetota bacterium]|nr:AAA family ATPase [Actinomycetota bacterium]
MRRPTRDIVRDNPLVGRETVLEDLARRVREADELAVVYVEAGEGMGKTTLLAHAVEALGKEEGTVALFAGLEGAAPASPADGAGSPALDQRLAAYVETIRELGKQLPGTAGRELAREVKEIQLTYPTEMSRPDLVSSAADEVGTAFVERVEDSGERLVLVLDDFHRIEGDVVANWLASTVEDLIGMPGAVLIGRAGPRPQSPAPRPDATVSVDELEPSAVSSYLGDLLGSAPSADECERIARWSGGHPFAVAMAARHLEQHGTEALADLERTDGAVADRMEPLIASLRQSGPAMDVALDVSAVVRHFDRTLLESVLAYFGIEPDPGLAERMAASGVLERLPGGRFRLRRYLRPAILRQLDGRSARTERFGGYVATAELHGYAHMYYEDQLGAVLEDRPGYAGWEHLERSDTHAQLLEYLYHAAHLTPQIARKSFALVYLDAFWWWGAYVRYPFCSRLVEEAERILGAEDEFARALRLFDRSYPVGDEDGDWPSVLAALEAMRAHVPLDSGSADRQMRHAGAIADVFRAEAHRYTDPRDGRADSLLESAERGFAGVDKDDWCIAWIRYEQADLALERAELAQPGDTQRYLAEAERLAGEAIEKGRESEDPEVMGNAYRVKADVAWLRGDVDAVFELLAEAAFHAYRFQATPQPADEYTRAFLREIAGTTGERLEQLAERDPAAAVRACVSLSSYWEPYWRALGVEPGPPDFAALLERGIWDDVVACVVPGEPRPEELARGELSATSPYILRVRRACDEVERREGPVVPAATGPAVPATGRGRTRSLAALADPVLDPDLFEPDDHPIWPCAWKNFPEDWAEIASADERRVQELLRAAIAELPPARREVLERRDINGESADDLARDGISKENQTVMLHRARAALQRALEPYFREREAA